MENLKKGDIITFADIRAEVMALIEGIVFTRRVYHNGKVGPLQQPDLIEDLIAYGYKKEEK